jgi:phage terminase large subunit-like protein
VEYERREHAREFERRLKGRSPGASISAGLGVVRGPLSLLDELAGEDEVARIGAFCSRFLRHSRGPCAGEPLRLAGFQEEFVREFYRRDEEGRRLYQVGLLGLPRGNGKTSLAAALGLYELCARGDHPQVVFGAASRAQAQLGVTYAREFASEGELARQLTLEQGSIRCRQSGGVLYGLGGDGRHAHGLGPTAAFVDELWALSGRWQLELYSALASSLQKRAGQAYLLATSTAGRRRAGKLWTIYQRTILSSPDLERPRRGLTVVRSTDTGLLAWWYGADASADSDDPALWRACNPAPWITDHDLHRLRHRGDLGTREFHRLILNAWPNQ